jgi:hypothetical protein
VVDIHHEHALLEGRAHLDGFALFDLHDPAEQARQPPARLDVEPLEGERSRPFQVEFLAERRVAELAPAAG